MIFFGGATVKGGQVFSSTEEKTLRGGVGQEGKNRYTGEKGFVRK